MFVYPLRERKVWIVVHKDRQTIPAFPYSWKTQAAARYHILKNARPGQAGDYLVLPGIETRTVRVDFKMPPRTKILDDHYRHLNKVRLDEGFQLVSYLKRRR